jgi:hypothetical protein
MADAKQDRVKEQEDPWVRAAERIKNTPKGEEGRLDSVTVTETLPPGTATSWVQHGTDAHARLQKLLANTGWVVKSTEMGALHSDINTEGGLVSVVEWDVCLEFQPLA